MAEDTNTTPAAAEPSIDDQLSAAAASAVAEQTETPENPPVEEKPETPLETPPEPPNEADEVKEPPKEELDEDGLPKDHGARSDLGRKLAALHRRQDETQATLDRVSQLLERVATAKTEAPAIDMPEMDPNETVTFAEVVKLMDSREKKKVEAKTNYDRSYSTTLERSFQEYTDEKGELNAAEIDGVLEEMKSIKYTPSNDPEKDALSNLRKAERAYLKKQTAQPKAKVNPLKGEPPRSPLGTTNGGKSPQKPVTPIKLDKDAEAYLKFVSASDGAEKADKLRASIGRE